MSLRLTTIIYHRVLESDNPYFQYEPTTSEFEKQVRLYSKYYNCLTVSDAVDKYKSKSLPWNSLCITFDDGYRDFYTNALPVLKKYNIPATVYVTTACLGGSAMWNDQLLHGLINYGLKNIDLSQWGINKFTLNSKAIRMAAFFDILNKVKYLNLSERQSVINEILKNSNLPIPKGIMLNEKELVELHQYGCEIGSHTVNHPILTSISDDDACKEILDSKNVLEKIINAPVQSFAFPNGIPNKDFNKRHIGFLQKYGYQSAISTSNGAQSGFDAFQIPRFSPAKLTGFGLILRMLKNQFIKSVEA